MPSRGSRTFRMTSGVLRPSPRFCRRSASIGPGSPASTGCTSSAMTCVCRPRIRSLAPVPNYLRRNTAPKRLYGAPRTEQRCSAIGTRSPTSRATCWPTSESSAGWEWRTACRGERAATSPAASAVWFGSSSRSPRPPTCFVRSDATSTVQFEGLVDLLDRFNEEYSEATGIWAVCAGMEDYLDLVDCHRQRLPVLELDPNPYWMGFYATRPNVKRTCNRLVRKLVLAEKLAFHTNLSTSTPSKDLHSAWSLVAVSNHHDFITGTTPDRVYQDEQLPWLVHAEQLADRCLDLARERLPRSDGPFERSPPRWSLEHGLLEVETPHYFVRIAEQAGGCFVSLRDKREGEERLSGPGNDLVVYRDSGGLWRMGHEFLGGKFKEDRKASDHPAKITATLQDNGLLAVSIVSHLAGERVVRNVWFDALTPLIRMHIEARAAEYTTVACRFPTVSGAETMAMDVPGGIVERTRSKLYNPTFWPARSFVHIQESRFVGIGRVPRGSRMRRNARPRRSSVGGASPCTSRTRIRRHSYSGPPGVRDRNQRRRLRLRTLAHSRRRLPHAPIASAGPSGASRCTLSARGARLGCGRDHRPQHRPRRGPGLRIETSLERGRDDRPPSKLRAPKRGFASTACGSPNIGSKTRRSVTRASVISNPSK